jgi:hypothetical protein
LRAPLQRGNIYYDVNKFMEKNVCKRRFYAIDTFFGFTKTFFMSKITEESR